MYQKDAYTVFSLELHLFFARIMKEHAFLLAGGYTPASEAFAKEAKRYKQEFENLLAQAIVLSNGVVSQDILVSGEILTAFTANAEMQTERLTGSSINKMLTMQAARLRCATGAAQNPELYQQVQLLNQAALRTLEGLIVLKEQTLNGVLHCQMYVHNYPLFIEHNIREAKLYRQYLRQLENGDFEEQNMAEIEQFWNQIMLEHALFMRSFLDPSECELIEEVEAFAKAYAELLEDCEADQDMSVLQKSLDETYKFRNFKSAGTQGILECKIRSMILPLLADHVTREANHYIRFLNQSKEAVEGTPTC